MALVVAGAVAVDAVATDADGLRAASFYVAANGYAAEAAGLVPTCRELARDGGDESLLRALLVAEAKAARAGHPVGCPRVLAAARVGELPRLLALVGADADVRVRDGRGRTALVVAALYGREAIVRGLLSMAAVDDALVAARVAAGAPDAGHSAFSLACSRACDEELGSGAYAACALLLAASKRVGPADLGGGDCSALWWACEARLADSVSALVAHPRCTSASDVAPFFASACSRAADDSYGKFSARFSNAACARAQVSSRRIGPADAVDSDGAPALFHACKAHLSNIVTAWLSDPRCTPAVVTWRDRYSRTAFSVACADVGNSWLDARECSDVAACVRALAATQHVDPGISGGGSATALLQACEARLSDVVTAFLADPRCTQDVVTWRDASGRSAFSVACAGATHAFLRAGQRSDAAACARALAASQRIGPDDVVAIKC